MSESKATVLSYCEITSDGVSRTISWPNRSQHELDVFAVGDVIGDRYVLRAELGSGGMGRVFLARDTTLDRDVALKIELQRAADNGSAYQPDLAREAKLAALLKHENIASVYDFGIHAGKPFTIFEYVEGRNLRSVMKRRDKWSVADVQTIIEPLADALDFAHVEGVIHSDLKPENICLSASGTPKILDFGIARNLHADFDTVTFRGTPSYASPEQATCRPADGRSDQYALGLITFELLAGRRPFLEDCPLKLLQMHERKSPPRLQDSRDDLPRSVTDAIMKTLEKDPNNRFATCREFAAAFSVSSHAGGTPGGYAAETEIHIAETRSESLVARMLARTLESVGYSTWYYQRDALPGIPLGRQVRESLQAARAALLLISHSSLASNDFANEVMAAHRLGRACLPVLVDVSLEEFESHQPIWRPVLGAAGIIELERDNIDKTFDRIVSAIELLGIAPSQAPSKADTPRRSAATQIWATDANQIEINELDRIVFKNEIINEFLNRKNKYFLSATKGLGKTLLLTFKRHLLTGQGHGDDAICLIPKGRPYLDFMSEMKSLSAKYESPLSDVSNCKRLWGAALRIAVLSHHGSLLHEDQLFELKPFPQRIQRWLNGANIEPTVVFKELTSLPISDVNRLIDNTENFLDQQIRQLHGATLLFVDKVDQAVRRLSRAAWINIQAGLIEAAWDLMSANSHIKVFASIRQEAFANYESDIKSNLFGATTMLRYSDTDLRSLVDRLASCYEGTSGYKEFVGVNVVKHPRREFPEDSFGFLRRYTFGRPRDFVAIASELSAGLSSLDEHRYCEIVRRTSAMGLVGNVFDELQVFLDCLQDRANRLGFLGQLPANILTRPQAIAVSARFNGLPDDSLWHFDEESPELFHPFRDLYLTGLLGFVRRNDQDIQTQRFRQPDDMLTDAAADLPNSRHYFIHPALSEYIQQHRQAGDYRIIQHVLVGENAAWHAFDPTICQIEEELSKVEDMNLRIAVHDLLSNAKSILLSAKPRNLSIELNSSADWKRAREQLERSGYDEVILWFEELLAC